MSAYGLIRLWHIIRPDVDGRAMSLCGRRVFSDLVVDLPAGKSCLTCLRISERKR